MVALSIFLERLTSFDEVVKFIQEMECKPDTPKWKTLLSICLTPRALKNKLSALIPR